VSQIVRDFYDGDAEREWRRLQEPLGQIEFASTLQLIKKYFPAAGRVCDIGGGPGRYTLELARLGYQVTLVELSEQLVHRARAALSDAGLIAEQLLCGDACDLKELPTGSFDAALMLGPLYHLVDRAKRLAALTELRRALKPGRVAIIAYLNSWGILRCGLGDFPQHYMDSEFIRSLLGEKTFRGAIAGFTECYWTTPPIAFQEIGEAGFEVLSYCGAEGFAGGMRPMVERIAIDYPTTFPNLVQLAAETSELPQYRDATEHLHIVVRANQKA
jgi:S-adenosylmethionine-dependent methyltransferase